MTFAPNEDLEKHAEALFEERFTSNAKRIDRLFAYLMIAQWLAAIVVALLLSPYTWVGKTHSVHLHVYLAVLLGGLISSLPVALAFLRPGWIGTRMTIAVAQMLWSALLIHLSGGRIETHFHVFGSLAFIAFYRDWRVLVPATVVVAADHLLRQVFWPESVYSVSAPEWWRVLEHAGWVLFEDVFLFIACIIGTREMRALARQQVAIEAHDRVAAARIQTSALPRDVQIDGLETAASMQTADTVGGDYYDLLPVDGGCWIAIGDVAGHGIRAGLTMLQAQSALGALVRYAPDARPADLWAGLNRTFVDNVRHRLKQNEHMTLSLIRYHNDGRLALVGAHEEIVIWRHRDRTIELVPIRGTWIGLVPRSAAAIALAAEEQQLQLEPNDVMVLYTDGIIEAKDAGGKPVGIERLREVVTETHARPVAEIRDAIFDLVGKVREDDASVMVFRYTGAPATA